MLTTTDNPYNPWTDYDAWFEWDRAHGYNTPAYLARLATTSDNVSEQDQELVYALAIESILTQNITGNYIYLPDPDAEAS